jgi:S-adenosylmethionine:tRNA ribosyltransferase-isomerase
MMAAAAAPRDHPDDERLLHVDPSAGRFRDARLGDLGTLLRAGDLLVVNDAATLPASLAARAPSGEPLEVRLAGEREGGRFHAVLFGAGDWRLPTERRPPPPPLARGDRLTFGAELAATVEEVDAEHPRLVGVRFDRDGAALWSALYRVGRPVQYSYLAGPLALWSVQTAYGSRPWSVEMPSAGRPLTWRLLRELGRRGVALAAVTHAAGLSSTGEPALDGALPLPERYSIGAAAVAAVEAARAEGGRVVAVGTTVVRALEGAAARHGGALAAGDGVTDLRVGPGFAPRVVDGLLTGMHDPTTSHFQLLGAFAPAPLLERAFAHAAAVGYLQHEFGDSNLILAEEPVIR